ncbi:MAG TPA: hypothetical protein VIF62_07000 [Labilithrix sp.]
MRSSRVAIVALSLFFAATSAHAEPVVGIDTDPEPPPPLPTMREAMHSYFAGELAEGWVFGGAGAVGIGAGAVAAFAAKDGFYKGAAWPLLGFGAIQLAAGVVLLLRTDRQIVERDAMLDHEKPAFYGLERPRMEKVRREFGWLAIAETALVVVGTGVAAYGGATRDHAFFGFGTSLVFESAVMLALDGRASDRADAYAAALARP